VCGDLKKSAGLGLLQSPITFQKARATIITFPPRTYLKLSHVATEAIQLCE
jgi:hypothetical protein